VLTVLCVPTNQRQSNGALDDGIEETVSEKSLQVNLWRELAGPRPDERRYPHHEEQAAVGHRWSKSIRLRRLPGDIAGLVDSRARNTASSTTVRRVFSNVRTRDSAFCSSIDLIAALCMERVVRQAHAGEERQRLSQTDRRRRSIFWRVPARRDGFSRGSQSADPRPPRGGPGGRSPGVQPQSGGAPLLQS